MMETKYGIISRLAAALDWVEANLDEKITVADVARRAHYSPFHFHRLFGGLVGMTLMDFVRRRRLTVAAGALRESVRPIIQIAFDAGFESQEAFTRAFKQFAGLTPGRYRKTTPKAMLPLTAALSTDTLMALTGGSKMEPKFVDLPAFDTAGLAGRFAVGKTEKIPELWEKFISIWTKSGRTFPTVSYGICYDESAGVTDGSMPFRYLAAFPIDGPAETPDGLETCTVPANHYAVFTHRGPVMNLKATYEEIYGTWMPASGYSPSGGPEFELYDERFNEETMSGEVDIYVPVMKSS